MSHELETAAVAALAVGARRRADPHDHHGDGTCANCGAVLAGRWCHECGQDSDPHHRSIWHLIWEALESFFHLDSRLWRTIPAIFFRPGRLAKDYMDGRVARHTPPFRTFLVALLLFIFAAESAIHRATEQQAEQKAAQTARLATPQGRAIEAQRMRAEAARDRADELRDAASERAGELKDKDSKPAKVEAVYQRDLRRIETRYADRIARADAVAENRPPPPPRPHRSDKGSLAWLEPAIKKAAANPEYYWTVLFTWGHRLAIVLLPIVGLSLALVYRNRRKIWLFDHLQVAMSFLSFSFLANALGLILPGQAMWWWLGAVALWTPINLFQTLRGGYGSSVLGAAAKALVVWLISATAFGMLMLGLLVFTLTQL